VGKRWTWVAWSMLTIYIVSMAFATILQIANGDFQQDAANQIVLHLGSVPSWSSEP
jgi:hypothetical protein